MLAPFLRGTNFSILSEKKITPILSLFWIAENASVAAISATIFLFDRVDVPNSKLSETSINNITVSFALFFKYFYKWLYYNEQ